MKDIKQEILKVFSNQPTLASFATVAEDGKPWARYVMITIDKNDMSMRFSTFVNSRKVIHIAKQPEVCLTCNSADLGSSQKTYLQIPGKAIFSTEKSERKTVWNKELEGYFKGIDDPNFGVIKINPYRIEVSLLNKEMCETLIWENY